MSEKYCLLSTRDLRRAIPFQGVNDIRYYLNGVYVDPMEQGGCRLVATNGHMLAVVHSPDSVAKEPFILRTDRYLREAVEFKALRNGCLRVVEKPSPIELLVSSTGDGQAQWSQPGPAFIDGRYPDWKALVEKTDQSRPGIFGAFQAKYAKAALALMLKASEREAERTIAFFQKDPESSLVIRSGAMLVMIMPMRNYGTSDISQAVPEWIGVPK